jgi:hypothetical protein
MHSVRRVLVEAQAREIGLPLWPVDLSWPCSNAIYEDRMRDIYRRAEAEGIQAVAFGDLFLQDIRDYRERQLGATRLRLSIRAAKTENSTPWCTTLRYSAPPSGLRSENDFSATGSYLRMYCLHKTVFSVALCPRGSNGRRPVELCMLRCV